MPQHVQTTAEHERLINAARRLAQVSSGDPLKLFRLLYRLDVQHFRDSGRSCTGETYYALADGPAPGGLRSALTMRDLDLDTAIGVLTATDSQRPWSFNARYFSSRDLALLDELETLYRDAPSWELALEDSHAWWRVYNSRGGVGAAIPYEMTVGESVTNSNPDKSREWPKYVGRLRAPEFTPPEYRVRSKPKVPPAEV